MANDYKKPSIEEFRKVLSETKGNMTMTAERFGVTRQCVWRWKRDYPEFEEAINESRKRLLDTCISTAQLVAQGIPVIENGKLVGWQVPPDSNMLRYFISTLGKDEGFGESMELNHKVEKGIDISKWIKQEMSGKKEE